MRIFRLLCACGAQDAADVAAPTGGKQQPAPHHDSAPGATVDGDEPGAFKAAVPPGNAIIPPCFREGLGGVVGDQQQVAPELHTTVTFNNPNASLRIGAVSPDVEVGSPSRAYSLLQGSSVSRLPAASLPSPVPVATFIDLPAPFVPEHGGCSPVPLSPPKAAAPANGDLVPQQSDRPALAPTTDLPAQPPSASLPYPPPSSSRQHLPPLHPAASSSPHPLALPCHPTLHLHRPHIHQSSRPSLTNLASSAGTDTPASAAGAAPSTSNTLTLTANGTLVELPTFGAATTTTSPQAPGQPNRLVGPPHTLHIPGDSSTHAPVPHTGWSVGAIHSGQQSSVLAVGTPHNSNFGYVSDRPGSMHMLAALYSGRTSGVVSPRMSSFQYQYPFLPLPPSPPRSSPNMLPSRVSMSGAGSVLSLPIETSSLYDFTAPNTGLVAEHTALEMGSLAPALDLWAAGAHVSPQAKIAQGAYGVVYRGLWHGCTCAVKLMLAASTENLSLQLTEVFVCKALSCHPNIVQTFDCNVWRITPDTLVAVQQLLGTMPGGMHNPLDGPSSSGLGPGGPGVAAGASSSFLAFHNSGLYGGVGGSVVLPSAAYSMGRGSTTSLAAHPSGTWAGAPGDMAGVGVAAGGTASVGGVVGGMGGGGGYFNSGERLRRASIAGRASTDRQDACASCMTRAPTSTSTSSSVQGSQHDMRHRSMGVGGLEPWVVAGSGSLAGSGGGTGMGRRELPRSGSGWMPQMAWEGAGSAAGMGSAGAGGAAGMGPGPGGSGKGSGGMWSGSMGAPPLGPGTPQVLINVSCSGCSSVHEGSCGLGQVGPSGAQHPPLLALPPHAKSSAAYHPHPHPCPLPGHPVTGLSRQRSWQREPHGPPALVSPLGTGPKSSPSLVPPRYLNPVSEERVSAIAAVTSGSIGSLQLTSPGAAASLLGADVPRLGSGLTTSSSRGQDHGGFSGPTRDPEQMVLSGSNREQEGEGEQGRGQGRARRLRTRAQGESEGPHSAGGTPASVLSSANRGAAGLDVEAGAAAGDVSGNVQGEGVAVGVSAALVHHQQRLTDQQQHQLNISRQLSSHVGSIHGPDTSPEFMLVSLTHAPALGVGLGTGGGAGVGVGLNTAAGAAGVFSDGGDSEQRARSKDCSVIGYITANNLFLPHSSMQEISPIKSSSRFGAPRGLGSDLRLSASGGMPGRSGSAGGADSCGSHAGGGGAVVSVPKVTASRTRSVGGVLGDGPRTSGSGMIDLRVPLPAPAPVHNQHQLHHAHSGPDLHTAAVSDTSSPGTPTGRQLGRGRGGMPYTTPAGLYGGISYGGPAWPGTAPGSGSATAAAQQQLQILMYQQQQQHLQQLQQQPRGAFDSPDRSRLTSPRHVHPPASHNPSPFFRSLSRGTGQGHGPGHMQASGPGASMAPAGTLGTVSHAHGLVPHALHSTAPGMGAGAGPPGSASVTFSPPAPMPQPPTHVLYNMCGGAGVGNSCLSRPASQATGGEISPVNSGLLPKLPPLPQQLSNRRPSGTGGLGGGFAGLGGGGGSVGLLGSRFPSERASAGTAAVGGGATAAAAAAAGGGAASILSTGDHAEHLAAESGARNLAQVLHALGAREGQLAVLVVMEECDRGSLQNLLNKAAVATAAAAAARQQQQQQQGHGPVVATPTPPDSSNSPFSAAGPQQPATPDLYAPFSLGGRYSTHAALRALVATAKEVALGMSFLHKNNIVHGDLKPGNVLLKSSRADQRGFVAKLSDFGLSRVLHTAATSRAMHGPHASHLSHASQRGAMRTLSMASGTGGITPMGPRSGRQAPGDYRPGDGFASGGGAEDSGMLYGGAVYGGVMYGGAGSAASAGVGAGGWQAGDAEPKLNGALDGTVPFLAPELIEDGQRSKASDVWAYGVLLWCLVTGKRPYEGLMHVQIMAAVVNGEQLLKWPNDAHPALQSLGHGCLAFEPQRRLTFAQIVRRLQGLELELRGEVAVGP